VYYCTFLCVNVVDLKFVEFTVDFGVISVDFAFNIASFGVMFFECSVIAVAINVNVVDLLHLMLNLV